MTPPPPHHHSSYGDCSAVALQRRCATHADHVAAGNDAYAGNDAGDACVGDAIGDAIAVQRRYGANDGGQTRDTGLYI